MNPLFANIQFFYLFFAVCLQRSKYVGFTHCPYKRPWFFFYHTSQKSCYKLISHLFSLCKR
ncbi:hypothetical protein Hanom_Chr13g01189801 [Helianthus anomalus]